MADSRRAAGLLTNQMQDMVVAQTRVIYFLSSIILAFLVTYFLSVQEPAITQNQEYVMFILVFAVALWITEAIPPFAVGILIVGLLIFLLGQSSTNQVGEPNYINVERFAATWSNSVIWLLLGGFFLAESLRKTGLDKELFRISVSKVGKKPQNVLLVIMMVTAVASMVMSNTATTAMMIASIAPFIKETGPNKPISKVLLVGVPAAAAIGGMGTIIGSPPNVIAVDAINNILDSANEGSFRVGFLEWMVIGVPVALLLVFGFWFALLKAYKIGSEDVEIKLEHIPPPENPIELFQRRVVIGVLVTTVLLWLTSNLHGIPAAAVSGIPIIVLPMVSIVTGTDVRQLPWDTLMLVAGGLSLGLAIKESGLAGLFVERLQDMSFSALLFMPIFAIATVLLSNIMSNTATATILIPIASIIPGVNPVALVIVIGLSASCALFLPVSTPPNAIAFSSGYLKQSDFRLGGTVIGSAGPVLSILWVSFLMLFWG
jgi:sodium-dependent dicarboxylate transporter 2/3/5